MRKTIEAQRLKLRPLRCTDAAAISRFTSDPGVARMLGSVPLPNPVVAVEGWMMILKARAHLESDYVYVMEAFGDLVGVIGAHARDGGYELGYWVGRPFWNMGFGTEAARAVAAEARASLGAIEASHYLDNPASGRVLEKAGFVYTGDVQPRFSLARGEHVDTRIMTLGAAALAA